MRLIIRFALAVAAAALPAAVALASCGTDAVGVAACQEIEEARCNLAPQCTAGFDVQRCVLYYRDECLVGLQNTSPVGDPSTLAPACVTALKESAACINANPFNSGDAGDSGCPGFESLIAPDASCPSPDGGIEAITPCSAILECPQVLTACAFVAGSVVDAGDAGDAETGTGGSGGSTTASTASSTTSASASSTGAGGASSSASSSAASSTASTGAGGAGGADAGDASTD